MSLLTKEEKKSYPCQRCGRRTVVKRTKRISGWYHIYCTNPSCPWDQGWMPPPMV